MNLTIKYLVVVAIVTVSTSCGKEESATYDSGDDVYLGSDLASADIAPEIRNPNRAIYQFEQSAYAAAPTLTVKVRGNDFQVTSATHARNQLKTSNTKSKSIFYPSTHYQTVQTQLDFTVNNSSLRFLPVEPIYLEPLSTLKADDVIRWNACTTDTQGNVLVAIRTVHLTNSNAKPHAEFILTPDDGEFTVTAKLLDQFDPMSEIIVSIMRGEYENETVESHSFLVASVFINHSKMIAL